MIIFINIWISIVARRIFIYFYLYIHIFNIDIIVIIPPIFNHAYTYCDIYSSYCPISIIVRHIMIIDNKSKSSLRAIIIMHYRGG